MDLRPALALILFIPLATGAPLTVVEDSRDDVDLVGGNVERWRPADLLRLDLDETGQSLVFELRVMPSDDSTRTLGDEMTYDIWFRHGTIVYDLQVMEGIAVSGTTWADGRLYRHDDPSSRGHLVAYVDVDADSRAGTFRAEVPRALIVDKDDVEPFRGGALRDVFVESRLYWALSTGASPEDRMPDASFGEAPIRLGTEQTGHVRLSSEGRIRGSNGEATTYLWTLNLTNRAEYPDTFTLSLSGPPATWEVRLPYAKAQVPANSSVQIPILATVPFAHQHGAIETFLVEARSLADADSVGRLDLGVEFLQPPQPAGHHDTVFIHGAGGDTFTIYVGQGGVDYQDHSAIMNTDPGDPEGSQAPIRGVINDCTTTRPRYGWVAELTPQLRLGLDFDMEDPGTFTGDFTSPLPLTDVRLDGRLLVADHYGASEYASHYDTAGGTRTVATMTSEQSRDIGQGETRTLTATIKATAEGDLVRFDPEQSLLMVLWLSGDGIPSCIGWQDHPSMEPGASMRLPLLEYHDPIDASFAAPDFISLVSNGPVSRLVAAGGTALWNLTLRNDGDTDRAFEVTLSGRNTEWARLPAGDIFIAPANGTVSIPVAVTPPAGQRQGDQADVIVEAVNVKDPRMRGLLRLVGTVSGSADGTPVQDDTLVVEAIEEAASKKSPAPAALVALLAALAMARAARRRL